MSGGNRGYFVAAIFGLVAFSITLGAIVVGLAQGGNRPTRYPGYTEAAQQPNQGPSPAIQIAAQPVKKKQPCENPQGRDESDLCAQWEAANAATDAAQYALWQTLLAAFGTVGVLVSLYYTRRALKLAIESTEDAEKALQFASRNADAAQDLVEVSRQTAGRQLRAYVYLDSADIGIVRRSRAVGGGFDVTFKMTFKNYGQTPAKNVILFAGYSYDKFPLTMTLPESESPTETIDIGPGGFLPNIHTEPFAANAIADVENGTHALYAFAVVRYVDVFDQRRETCVCIYAKDKDAPNGLMRPYMTGNTAT